MHWFTVLPFFVYAIMVWCGLCKQEVAGTTSRALSLHQNRHCTFIPLAQPNPKPAKRPRKRRRIQLEDNLDAASGSSSAATGITATDNQSVSTLLYLSIMLSLFQILVDLPETILSEPEPVPQPENDSEIINAAEPTAEPMPEPEINAVTGPRIRRLPKRLLDFQLLSRSESNIRQLQRPPSPSPEPILTAVKAPPIAQPVRSPSPEWQKTELDEFGLYRVYVERPTRESDDSDAPDYGCDAPTFDNVHNAAAEREKVRTAPDTNPFAPFANATKFRLTNWIYSMTKSNASFDSLVNDVIRADDFEVNDLEDWNTAREVKALEQYSTQGPSEELWRPSDGWLRGSVKIPLPCRNHKWKSESDAPQLEVSDIPYRSLIDVIKSACRDSEFFNWHLKGYKQMWKPSENEPVEQVHGEVWFSNQYLIYEDEIRNQRLGKGPPTNPLIVETVILPLLLYSDQTHLAQFGTALLWPMYMSFGLLSKYIRCKPSSLAWHHILYFPTVRLC